MNLASDWGTPRKHHPAKLSMGAKRSWKKTGACFSQSAYSPLAYFVQSWQPISPLCLNQTDSSAACDREKLASPVVEKKFVLVITSPSLVFEALNMLIGEPLS